MNPAPQGLFAALCLESTPSQKAHWAAQAPRHLVERVRGALLVASDNDPAASAPRALALAHDWGAESGCSAASGTST